jgi:OOP family OmpA-OmpF porin
MKTKQTIGLAAAVSLALVILSGSASAQQSTPQVVGPQPAANTGYLRDTRGAVPMSAYGLCWHTGTGPASAWTAGCDPALVPAPVAKVVAPAPIVMAAVAPAPKPVAQKLTFDADALFDFDKSTLRPAGRATLDDFVDRIKGINPEAIMTVGHTDRIGSSPYNQRLSEERAESVKTYLVGIGIASNRVQTSGKGETQPVTLAGECLSGSAKVIACLQPDRRVDIELIGAKIQ